jgi:enolase
MSRIQAVKARQVFDSRGNPTVECEVITADGTFRAIVPSGGSSGTHEAIELRDGDKSKFGGKGVLKAVENVVGEISDTIIGMDPTDQEGIDQAMMNLDGGDEPTRKTRLGANAVLAVSMAVCRAGAGKKDMPLFKHINSLAGHPTIMLPVPCFNMISGGAHSGNGLAMQEFAIMPTGAETFAEAMQIGVEVYQTLKRVIRKTFGREETCVSDEGGFAPSIKDNEEALKLLSEAVKASGYEDHCQVVIDAAAGDFFDKDSGKYDLAYKRKGGATAPGAVLKNADELLRMYKLFAANYGVASIEDPFHENDWAAFSRMTNELGEVIQVVGDGLLVTNAEKLEMAIEQSACNAMLLKLNQIGTVSETIAANGLARNAGMGVMVSHRTGDSEDTFIADLAVGLGCGQIKSGAPCRSEHVAKYNQLLRIEEALVEETAYAGDYFRDPWLLEKRTAKKKNRFDL